MEHIDETELYRVINRALTQTGKNYDEPVNKEILLLKEKYTFQVKQKIHPSLLDKQWILVEEINAAQEFCNALEAYRLATDVHVDDTPELLEPDIRRLHSGIERFGMYISDENNIMVKALTKVIRSRLPEFRSQYILEQYNEQALLIYKLKKKRKSQKSASVDYERLAAHFFAEILNDEELKNINICPEKMDLYVNTINIVDCLPKEKYNKTAKFLLKSQLYYAVSRSALILDNPDKTRAKEAYKEYLRFKNAAEKAMAHATNPHIVDAIRRKKQQDEWKYK